MTQIQSQIDQLAQDTGPRVDVQTGYRGRSGETGLSKLDEIKGSAKFSTGAAGGRVFAKAEAVVIDAGRPTGSGLARFGRNATPEAQGIVAAEPSALVNADTQNGSGVALSAGYENDWVQLEGGTTPIGMGKTKFAGRAAVTPKLGQNVRATAFVEQKPVTDSIVSYAGTRDPVTGERWGQVMRTAGGLGLSYDENGSGRLCRGTLLPPARRERGEQRWYRGQRRRLSGSLQGPQFTRHRGPQRELSGLRQEPELFHVRQRRLLQPAELHLGRLPVNYTMQDARWDVAASFTPGFQSYKEDQTAIYPTDDTAQAELNALKAENSDVRSYFDSLSKTGFALSAQGSLYYKITPNTRIGGELGYNTFGSYDEFRSILGVRQSFGSTGK
ncbi:cellulose synthase subunit BcsC-related outer membrane protein [Novosphingobium resinovorum]|uniref:cellulose synthase subunit BcsC-related outer membrane protein n=1 Tax=Novosphingobium resinovorum TaxID=158500 RepID=UPI003D2BEBF4